jgi:hypothetical protein
MPRHDRAQKLIDHLLSHPDSCESDGVAYELLNEYFRGSPIETLRVLLSSSDDRLVGEATWIASELPELGKPLLKDVRGLLGHQSKKVRFWAVLCVLLWADSSNGCELASAIPLVDDIEKGVRWQAMGFLSMTSREQLQAALAQLRAENANSPYICELGWLLGPEGGDPVQITAALQDPDSRRRKFGAAAAFRIAKTAIEPLRYAASADDPEIAQFAGDMLKRISSAHPDAAGQ